VNNNISITEAELQHIDDYITGRLSTADKLSFEQKLANSEDWTQKLNHVVLLSTGIQEAALREKLDEFHSATTVTKPLAPVRNINRFKSFAVAASVIAVVSTLSWVFFFKQSPDEKMYAAFYKPDPGLSTEMGVSDNYIFDRAMVDYKTGEFKNAIESWSKLLAANATNDTLHYFIAAAQMADKNIPAAIAHFDKVLQNPQSVFINDAQWYKGLALLKQGKKQEAMAIIEKTDHSQKQALLLKLKD